MFNGKAPFQAETRGGAYWIINARMTWALSADRYKAQLFVQNITNKLCAYSRVASTTETYMSSQCSPPRTYGIRLSMKLDAN